MAGLARCLGHLSELFRLIGGTYGFIEQVGLKDCARPGKVYPYSLSFKPTDAVKNQYPTNTKTSFTDQLSSIEVGTVFFEVYAKAGPSSKSVKIGEMKSTSKFTTSKFGDDELFFQHAYELDDIQSACDDGLPDCNDWLSATHRFTGNTFPFGPSPPPIPSSRRSESGCPLRRALEEKDARINELEAQLKSDA